MKARLLENRWTVEITDFDITTASNSEVQQIGNYLLTNLVVVLKDQYGLLPGEELEFCERFGKFRFVNKKSNTSFEGKIVIPKDISGCESHMLNKNILLDNQSDAYSKPELEIHNDDTICTHGCTIGALDEEQIFYLQHRGLTYDEAVEILVQGFTQGRVRKFYK